MNTKVPSLIDLARTSDSGTGAVDHDQALDEHNYEVLVHEAPMLTTRNVCATVFDNFIYVAYVEDTEQTTAKQLADLERFNGSDNYAGLGLTLKRFDRTGTLVQEEWFTVLLKPGAWRRVLHTDNYWLYGVLFGIKAVRKQLTVVA